MVCIGLLLVCDPYQPVYQVQGFRGEINGQAFDTPYTEVDDPGATFGKSAVIYDCNGLGDEAWKFTNVRAYNVRGESVGIPFDYPAKPPSISGTHLK